MSKSKGARTCPRCGEAATGKFCANCGAALAGATCRECGRPLSPGARFCEHCGAPVSAPAARGSRREAMRPWFVAGAVLVLLAAFVIGQRIARTNGGETAGTSPPAGLDRGSDITAMSPEERANRLFDRVMRYSEEGKIDSARFFAPMAIQAYEMLGTLDAHARYDIGMISAVTGDVAAARAQADTILRTQSTHLLGLVLAIRSAPDPGARVRYERRLAQAEKSERAKALNEYADHARDIDGALKAIADRSR